MFLNVNHLDTNLITAVNELLQFLVDFND